MEHYYGPRLTDKRGAELDSMVGFGMSNPTKISELCRDESVLTSSSGPPQPQQVSNGS